MKDQGQPRHLPGAPWTPEYDELLRQMWTDGARLRDISEALGKSENSIDNHRRRLGLPPRMVKRSPDNWLPVDDQTLIDMWGTEASLWEMRRILRRSRSTIQIRRKHLGLPDRPHLRGKPDWVRKGLSRPESPSYFESPDRLRCSNGDEKYVAACLALGGFPARAVVNGKTVELRAA